MTKMKLFEVKARAWVITFAVLITYHLSLATSTAQTFTQRVQQHTAGEGVVTIHHDKAIENLVNGSASASTSSKSASKSSSATTKTKNTNKGKETASANSANKGKETASKGKEANSKDKEPASKDKETASKDKEASKGKNTGNALTTTPKNETAQHPTEPHDTTTVAVPRHTMKVTGFRVQAFAGGNTRTDRQRAEHAGNVMRQLFPGDDVYVRFYSPRWVCRVGNYRTYEEARAVLLEVRKQGYESATIVKGKIVVPID